jgi:hypothetical protein
MINNNNLNANSSKVANTSGFTTDKVIYSESRTINVTNSLGAYGFTFTTPPLNQITLPVGVYSTDGGNTWADFSTLTTLPVSWGTYTPPGVFVFGESNSNNSVTYTVQVNSTVGGGSTFPLMVSLALLAIDNPSPIANIPVISPSVNKAAFSTIDPTTKLPIDYRQIVLSNSIATTAGAPGAQTIAHGLNYIPDIMFWTSSGGVTGLGNNNFSTPNFTFSLNSAGTLTIDSEGIACDGTNLYIGGFPATGFTIYRGYKP